MPSHSSVARLLQGVLAAQLAGACAWLAMHLPGSPGTAVAGAATILLFFAPLFALEYLILGGLARSDPAPRATTTQMLRAWWCETCEVPVVFGWRQAFRWRDEPDHLPPAANGRRGVVLIHGFICNRGFWTPWLAALRRQGQAFVAVNLEPVFGSIDGYAPIVDAAVNRVTAATGLPPVLLCHSMGGLAARAWLRSSGRAADVHRVITIASPHQGTWIARFGLLRNTRQMRRASAWLRELEADERQRARPPFICWYSNCDNIVMPPSTATLPDADNRLVPGAAHVELALHPEVMRVSLHEVTS